MMRQMQCRPGDTALIASVQYADKPVEVLYKAPETKHELPNGVMHVGDSYGDEWVVKLIDWSIQAENKLGQRYWTQYGTIRDCRLTPVRLERPA